MGAGNGRAVFLLFTVILFIATLLHEELILSAREAALSKRQSELGSYKWL